MEPGFCEDSVVGFEGVTGMTGVAEGDGVRGVGCGSGLAEARGRVVSNFSAEARSCRRVASGFSRLDGEG